MSDQKLWGTIEDVNPRRQTHLTLDNYGPRSQVDPPLRYEVCVVCGFVYRRDEMVRYKKKWYCKVQECHRDIAGIELNKDPENWFKSRSMSSRFWRGATTRRA